MNTSLPARRAVRARPLSRPLQQGVILIIGLLFLLAITLLSLAMVRSYGIQERSAGNTRDKSRSFEAAQSALNYGEWWLSSSSGATTSTTCSTANNPQASLVVCTNALANPATVPWPAWSNFTPPGGFQVQAGTTMTGGDIYQALPGLYIGYVGFTPDGNGVLYQVNAFSGGGSFETQTVVQSVYKLQTAAKDLGGNP